MPDYLHPFSADDLTRLLSIRPGETKLGQCMGLLGPDLDLSQAYECGFRFAIIGIPEDVGPRANLGFAGATDAFDATLSVLLNMQSNQFLSGEQVLIAGQVDIPMAAAQDTDSLRESCHQVDLRVTQVISAILEAGLVPIVIGGGHNNALPILRACQHSFNSPMAVANLDPHSDFRAREGRHSGNPFRYAHEEGILSHYCVVGLHEQKNNRDSLQALAAAQFPFYSLQSWAWRREFSLEQILDKVSEYLSAADHPIGLELDTDAISELPSSAMTYCGVSAADALFYVHKLATLERVCYLHLAEAAPARHPSGIQAGRRVVGQMLSELICAFIKARLAMAQ